MVKTNSKHRLLLPLFLIGAILLSIGGVIAFSIATTTFNNHFRLSAEEIEHTETFDSPEDWQPCDETAKTVITTNDSSHPVKVRLKYDEWWRNKADTENLPLEQDGSRLTTINFQNETDWEKNGDWYYWKGELAPGESTNSLFKSVTLSCDANFASDPICIDGDCTENPNPYEEAKYHIDITIQTADEDFPSDTETRTVTVDPNGGTYKGSTSTTTDTVALRGDYTLEEVTRTGFVLDHWEYADGARIYDSVIRYVTDNLSIRAIWTAATARLERTGELYPTLADAQAAANDGDTITLLTDVTETVANDKNITIDLGNHTITGSLTNDGTITIINGEINNPNGVAITNNGTLTMGVDDYTDQGPNIQDNYVRIIGTTIGIDQNGTFNYYDGFIEGDVALDGGHNSTPSYDGTVYNPFIAIDTTTNRQRITLASSEAAVSKTTIGGDVYYSNLQDNINVSAETGYKIYIVRSFSADYPISIPADTVIGIDIAGYDINLNSSIVNNGNLTLEDSATTTDFGGIINTQSTLVNNSNLVLRNIKIQNSTANDTIQNNSSLTMVKSELANTTGHVMQPVSGASYNLDDSSIIHATGQAAAVYNTIPDFTWSHGTIRGDNIGLQIANDGAALATINGGIIYGDTAVQGAVIFNYGSFIGEHIGLESSSATIYGGYVEATSNDNTSYGIYAHDATTPLVPTDHQITIIAGRVKGGTYGIYAEDGYNVTLSDGTSDVNINIPEITSEGYAIYGNGNINFYDGRLHANIKAAPEGTINNMPDNYELHISSSDDYLENAWLVRADTYLEVNGVGYATLGEAYNAITGSSGTIKVIKTVTVDAILPDSPANKTITFDLNGHELTYTQPLVNKSTMVIIDSSQAQTGKLINLNQDDLTSATVIRNDHTLTVQSGHILGGVRGIVANGGATTTNIYGGTVEAPTAIEYIRTLSTDSSTVNITGGLIKATEYGVRNPIRINMNGGEISVTGSGAEAYGIYAKSNLSIQPSTSATITVTNTAGDATGVWAGNTSTIDKAIINASGTKNVYGVSSSYSAITNSTINATNTNTDTSDTTAYKIYGLIGTPRNATDMSGNTITANGNRYEAYGIYSGTSSYMVTLTNNTISSTSSTGTNAYGIYTTGNPFTIQNGTITSSKYGITSTGTNKITLGINDYDISTTSPEIIGADHALGAGSYNFYDGILRGNVAYNNGAIAATPSGSTIQNEASADYAENCWLKERDKYLEVGDKQYANLDTAYAAITGDSGTIKVIRDVTIDDTHPASPANKNITFDLNGHNLIYTKPIINGGTMTITDSSEGHVGTLTNNAANSNTITNQNNKNLTIDNAHIIYSNYIGISNSGTVTITDSLIEGNYTAISNNSTNTANIIDSTIKVTNYATAISNSSANLNMSGNAKIDYTTNTKNVTAVSNTRGAVSLSGNAYIKTKGTYTSSNSTYGINSGSVYLSDAAKIETEANYISHSTYQLTDLNVAENSTATITSKSTNSSASAVNSVTTANIHGGIFESNAKNASSAISSVSTGIIENAHATATSNSGSAISIVVGGTNTLTIKNNTLNSTTTSGIATGVNVPCLPDYPTTLNNNNITATSSSSDAYGVAACRGTAAANLKDAVVNIDGDTIVAKSSSRAGYGVYGTDARISSGSIRGSTYGVYTIDGYQSTVGSKDGSVSITNPVVIGNSYALYGGNINFYDGILKGGVGRYSPNSVFSDFETGYTPAFGSETIDTTEYDTAWLVPEHNVARVGSTGVEYTRLDYAINNAANTGDTVYLIADNYVTYDITIPNTKSIIVDLNGYDMYVGVQITNNGNLDFANGQVQTQTGTIEAASLTGAFINNTGATLGFEDVELKGKQPIDNKGETYVINAKVEGTDTSIVNTGTVRLGNANIVSTGGAAINNSGYVMTDQNNILNGYTYALYNNTSEATLESMSTEGSIYVYGGKVEIANSNVTRSGALNSYLINIESAGEMILDNTTVFSNGDTNITPTNYAVNNAGKLSANDSTFTSRPRANDQRAYIIYNYGGNTTLIESTVSLDITNLTSKVLSYGYGIYNSSGTTNFAGGIIDFPGRTNYAYGIYANAGTVIIGKPVPTSDPNRGTAAADVSTTNPNIKAVGNYGQGVYDNNATIEFYDGKVSGKQGAFSKTPDAVEYNWRIQNGTDPDGYPSAILVF